MRLSAGRAGAAVAAAMLLLLLSAPAAAEDMVRIRGGGEVKGRIVAETADDVTVEIAGGGIITIARREILEIHRDEREAPAPVPAPENGPKPPPATPEPARPDGPLLRAEHFLVWSGGQRVGYRSLYVRKRPEGGLLLEEESTFLDADGKEEARIRITETVDETLAPVSLVYREIALGGNRLLEGTVRGEVLEVVVTIAGKRNDVRLTLPDEVRFPLAAREFMVRERERLKGAWEARVFDPREENFFVHRFENRGARKIDWEGAATEVTVIRRIRGSRPPEEIWIDGAGRTLTEELNGPEVVSVRTTAERIDALREGAKLEETEEERRIRPHYVSPEAGFKIRKPSMSWTFAPGEPGNRKVLSISNVSWFAYVDVIRVPEAPEDGLLSALAVETEKRFAAASEDFRKLSDGYVAVGGERAYRMEASSTNRGEAIRSWIVAVAHGGKTWYIAMACPAREWEGAKPEFEAILSSFEFLD